LASFSRIAVSSLGLLAMSRLRKNYAGASAVAINGRTEGKRVRIEVWPIKKADKPIKTLKFS
jgi:hypothetical protein